MAVRSAARARSEPALPVEKIVPPEQDNRDYVNSFARGLEVIRAFNRAKPSMTLSQVAERTDLNRAAARRFLLTLVREGYAETNGKFFRLRPKILELGFSVLSSMEIWEIAQPIMTELADKLDETCLAAVLDDPSVVYVARASSRRLVNIEIRVGSRLPAFCMSSGRVLLAALRDDALDRFLAPLKLTKYTENTVTSKAKLREIILEVRRLGWAIVDEEYEIGFRSLSVPIRDRGGTVLAALNVSCPSPRVTLGDMRVRYLPEALDASRRISLALPE